MIVYRLETSDGRGVFSSGGVMEALKLIEGKPCGFQSPYRHPDPYQDIPEWEHRNDMYSFYCGFISIDQLLNWFDSEALRQALNKVGVTMKEYSVPDDLVLHGQMQIMFKKELAELIAEHSVPVVPQFA